VLRILLLVIDGYLLILGFAALVGFSVLK